jgi:hypothetical protein
MYFVLGCLSPSDGTLAMLSYDPDHPMRSWASGTRFDPSPDAWEFDQPPPEPVTAEVVPGYEGIIAELFTVPVPLMTRRLLAVLRAAGVDNIDAYDAVIRDNATGKSYTDHVAFNLIGAVAAADLERTLTSPYSSRNLIARDIDALVVSETAANGLLMFRLAESVNAILVHDSLKQAVEAAGIDTLSFFEPDQWAG